MCVCVRTRARAWACAHLRSENHLQEFFPSSMWVAEWNLGLALNGKELPQHPVFLLASLATLFRLKYNPLLTVKTHQYLINMEEQETQIETK